MVKESVDEFSFVAKDEPAKSPGRSIMKKLATSSPRKNVVFTTSVPEIIHYDNKSIDDSKSIDDDDRVFSERIERELNPQWNQLDPSSEDEPAPLPPPHNLSFQESLEQSIRENENDEHLKHHSFQFKLRDDISLNDKLDIFLNNTSNNDDLDTHLSRLHEIGDATTNHHISSISRDLHSEVPYIENPLTSLVKSNEIRLPSAGSSQSSLQSLLDDNRALELNPRNEKSKGIELNDGIHGFSNDMVNQLVSQTTPDPRFETRSQFNDKQPQEFDNSYNHTTEQSIMDLLNQKPTQVKQEPGTTDNLDPVVKESPSMRELGVKQELEAREPILFETMIERPLFETSIERPLFETSIEKPILKSPVSDYESEAEKSENHLDLRGDIDENWKFEDSHDGDKEDNDMFTNNDLTMVSTGPEALNKDIKPVGLDVNFSPESSVEFESPSKSLAPPKSPKTTPFKPTKVDVAIDATTPPTIFRPSTKLAESREATESAESAESAESRDTTNQAVKTHNTPIATSEKPIVEEILANSTNVPEDISLPAIETNNYSSFEEITRTLNAKPSDDDFEQSLSAEFDDEKATKKTSFLSIWHSQTKPKSPTVSPNIAGSQTANITVYDANNDIKVPDIAKTRKFHHANLMSTRVVSNDHISLNVSDFLPELSEDSGFQNQFRGLVNTSVVGANSSVAGVNTNNTSGENTSSQAQLTENILSDVDNVPAPPPSSTKPVNSWEQNRYSTLNPIKPPAKTSKFRVPSFNVKISNATTNTRDKYNDIFHDTTTLTIKSHGIKTLPSMDKDDVQKILNTKRVFSHEEYSQMKLGTKAAVHENDRVDALLQKASIHNADYSGDSLPVVDHTVDSSVLPHLAEELMRNPTALLSKEQLFNDSDVYTDNGTGSGTDGSVVIGDVAKNQLLPTSGGPKLTLRLGDNDNGQNFPDPDPELISSPMANIFKTPPRAKDDKSAIKISSPLKLVKKGSTVTSIVIDRQSLMGSEFSADHNKKMSLVSVPSMYTTHTEQQSVPSSHTLLDNSKAGESRKHSSRDSVLRESKSRQGVLERGRLFFRVVGLKNINLPDIGDQNGQFTVTLDNGVHCIKTPSYEMKEANVLIGKEFELMVGTGLEFIMTMKMTYAKPKGKLVEVRERKLVKSKNKLGRMFGSKDVITTTKFVASDPVDPWATKFAPDGSFGRCYVDLSQYEDKITYCANSFDIGCFNEWETVATSSGSIQAKPYRVATLEARMLYVPRTELHEALPTSIKSAHDVVELLGREQTISHHGYLNQDGGDCDGLKRRFFKLQGHWLVAHSEFSHKTRAKINLSKIVDVIYVNKGSDIVTAQKVARNFSDVLLVPESFKIRFSNGETIDFGAPNMAEKFQWISLFEQICQINKYRRLPWVQAMQLAQPQPQPQLHLDNKSNNPFYDINTKLYH